MQVTVEYAAQLKRAAGCASESVELGAAGTLQNCLAQIGDRHGEEFCRLLFDADGNVQASILLFVGDVQIQRDQTVDLRDNDVITILSPISGG